MSHRARANFWLASAVLSAIAMIAGIGVAIGAASDPWDAPPIGGGGIPSMTISAQGGVAVTPSATVDIAKVPRAIYSHDGGNVACRFQDGTSVIFLFAAGEIKPLRCSRVLVTGTDSANISALY